MYFGKSKPSKRRAHSHVLVDCLRRSLRCFLNAAALTLPSIIFFLHVAEWNAASAIIKPPCFSKNSLLLHILHPSAAGTTHALSGTPPPTSLFSYSFPKHGEKPACIIIISTAYPKHLLSVCSWRAFVLVGEEGKRASVFGKAGEGLFTSLSIVVWAFFTLAAFVSLL